MLFIGGMVFTGGALREADVLIDGERIVSVLPFSEIPDKRSTLPDRAERVIDCIGKIIIPGFVDVHVHLREPGFLMKETILSGTRAAARAGYTQVCAMPNVSPAPDSPDSLRAQLDIIAREAAVRALPYAAITIGQRGQGELVDFDALAPHVAGFSDDGRGIQSEALMREAMCRARAANAIIAAHCEDDALARGGLIHGGEYARAHGLPGISSESEWRQLERDLRLVRETGCRYHLCHASSKESVALLRAAKAEGLPVTAETAPHYLLLDDSMIEDHGRFKMNPPIRAAADRDALVQGAADGVIDVIATDHAPHTAAEKAGGLKGSVMGVIGLETAFPALYTGLVLTGALTLEALLERMCVAPRRAFGLPGGLVAGGPADLAVLDVGREYLIDPNEFHSKGRSTPFEGWKVRGEAVMTVVNGRILWSRA